MKQEKVTKDTLKKKRQDDKEMLFFFFCFILYIRLWITWMKQHD